MKSAPPIHHQTILRALMERTRSKSSFVADVSVFAGILAILYALFASGRIWFAPFTPAAHISSSPRALPLYAIKRVDKAVYDTSKAVKDGAFKAGDNSFNATNDGIGFGKLDAVVPADAKAAADKALADIKSGAIKPKTDLTVK